MGKLEKASAVAGIISIAGVLYDQWWQRRQKRREQASAEELQALRERIEALENRLTDATKS